MHQRQRKQRKIVGRSKEKRVLKTSGMFWLFARVKRDLCIKGQTNQGRISTYSVWCSLKIVDLLLFSNCKLRLVYHHSNPWYTNCSHSAALALQATTGKKTRTVETGKVIFLGRRQSDKTPGKKNDLRDQIPTGASHPKFKLREWREVKMNARTVTAMEGRGSTELNCFPIPRM